jgi:hypothetical protein
LPSVVAPKEFDIQMDWTHASLATNLQPFMFLEVKQGVCHTVALPFTLKIYLKAKEEL